MINELEELIDDCNDVLDEEQNEMFINLVDRSIKVSDRQKVKHIRAMAYALRQAIYDAEEE